jgi:hypothetical protein
VVSLAGAGAVCRSRVARARADRLDSVPVYATVVGPLPEDVVADSELEWAVLADLVSDLDIDSAREAGLAAGPGAADTALLQLTFAEREELMRLLKEELKVGS